MSETFFIEQDIERLKRKESRLSSNFINSKDRQVTNRGAIYDSPLPSDGTAIGASYVKRYTATENTHSIKLVYGNTHTRGENPIIDTANANDITIKASISIGSDLYQVKFDGQKTKLINPGGIVTSDEVGIEIPAGTNFFIRTYVSVASLGQVWMGGQGLIGLSTEGMQLSDITESATLTLISMGSTGGKCGYYTPMAIIGKSLKPSVLLVGDSIMAGSGDGDFSNQANGYTMRALDGKFNYGVIAKSSDKSFWFNVMSNRQVRIQMAKYYDYAVCNYGINDVGANRTLVQIQTDLIGVWNALIARGLKVFQNTITPFTSSTDSWATTAGQAPMDATKNSVRIALNEWIRTCPAPLSGYFESADLAESSRNSGIWKAGYTGDGLHPNKVGHIDISACIDTSKFV